MSEMSVLFVCVSNAGKSQMAAALMRGLNVADVQVFSAGTDAGTKPINALSAEVLGEWGIDISDERPTRLTEPMIRDVDLVVVLGSDAVVQQTAGTAIERWVTDEPSVRGIGGAERMRLIRDDIDLRVRRLADRLTQR